MSKRILVTGGAGFIGSHTVEQLLAKGYQVSILDNLSSGKTTNLPIKHPNLRLVKGDILDPVILQQCVDEADAVLHLAAIPSVTQSVNEPISTFNVNALGFLQLLVALQHPRNKHKGIVYASSAAVYGDASVLPCDDEKPLSSTPLSPYALHKINNEQYANLYHQLHGINSIGLRYFNVYGDRQDPNSPYSGVISLFLKNYCQETVLKVYGDGLQSRDFVHVSDIARANCLAIETVLATLQQKSLCEQINIATGKPQTLLQLIQCIAAAGPHNASVSHLPARVGDIKMSYGTTQKAARLIQFEAKMSLLAGIRQLVEVALPAESMEPLAAI